MPDELYIGSSSINVYLNIHRTNPSTGLWQIWKASTSAWVSFTVGDIANYALAATETNGNYVVNVTTSIGTGPVLFVWRQRAGGSVATSDVVLEKYNVAYDADSQSFMPASSIPGGLAASVEAGVSSYIGGGSGYDTLREIIWGADPAVWSGLTDTWGYFVYNTVARQATVLALPSLAAITAGVWTVNIASPVAGSTLERIGRIPNAASGGNGGLPTVDANNRIVGIQGTLTTLDALDTAQDSQHTLTYNRLGAPSGASLSADIQTRATNTGVWTVSTASPTASTFGERLTRIPNAAAGGAGGLPTVDASNRIAGIQGTITTLDALDTAQDAQHLLTYNRLGAPSGASIAADVLTRATDAGVWTVIVTSPTANSTLERLGRIPNAAAGSNGGLPTVNANNQIAGIAGTITTLDGLDTAQDTQHAATFNRIGAPTGASLAADVQTRATQTSVNNIPTNVVNAIDQWTPWIYMTFQVNEVHQWTAQLQDGGTVDNLLDAIKAKTDTIPANPAAVGSAMTLTSGERNAIVAANNASVPPVGYFANSPSGGGSGGGPTDCLLETTVAEVLTGTICRLTTGSTFDSYSRHTAIFYDVSNSDYPSVERVATYDGSTKILTIVGATQFTLAVGDKVKIFAAPAVQLTAANNVNNSFTETRE